MNNINLKYGKLAKYGLVNHAPANLTEQQCISQGYMEIVKNPPPAPPDDKHIYAFHGYIEKDGKIVRDYVLREKPKEIRLYDKMKILENIKDVEVEYMEYLKKNLPEIYDAFQQSLYFEDSCDVFKAGLQAYAKIIGKSIEEAAAICLKDVTVNPSEIRMRRAFT